jgi:Animal haem peroxidase
VLRSGVTSFAYERDIQPRRKLGRWTEELDALLAGNAAPTAQGPAFAAGDVRAQENPDLTALQTLFVREHNYQVDLLHREHPNWSGDRLYQMARAITTAEIANITYNEFLPHLLGPNAIPAYHGYDPAVNPTITEEFEGAAYP